MRNYKKPGYVQVLFMFLEIKYNRSFLHYATIPPPPSLSGAILPYMGCIDMYGPKWYGFSAVLGINRVTISAICGFAAIWSSIELIFLEEVTSFYFQSGDS